MPAIRSAPTAKHRASIGRRFRSGRVIERINAMARGLPTRHAPRASASGMLINKTRISRVIPMLFSGR